MSIATPEGLDLDVVLAGAGSRVIAGLFDAVLKGLVLVAAFVATVAASPDSGVLVALWALVFFAVWFGYDVLFEVAAGGRTPGKRWTGLRVLTDQGGAIGIGPSVVRNLLRLVDAIPGAYLVGILLVVFTRRHQRLGDLVAGTIVVRERREVVPELTWPISSTSGFELATWDVSGVTADEVATVRRFLERRSSIDPAARRRLAEELATRLLPRVVGPTERPSAERFLEDLVAVKSHRS